MASSETTFEVAARFYTFARVAASDARETVRYRVEPRMSGGFMPRVVIVFGLLVFASGLGCSKSTTGGTTAATTAGGTGSTGGSCTGEAPLCANQQGVCAGSRAACVNGQWVTQCGAEQYGSRYSPTESTCDGVDHNCDGMPSGTVSCGSVCCGAGQACLDGLCQQQLAQCGADAGCQADSRCLDGQCVPWTDGGYDATCTHPAQPAHFAPSIRCAWPPLYEDGGVNATGLADPQHVQVLTTPLVADFKLYTGSEGLPVSHPMVVFPTQNSLGGGNDEAIGNATYYGLIRILDPQGCSVVATLDGANQHVVGASTPAIGDLDGDGRPEIVAAAVGGGLLAFTYDANTKAWKTLWHSTNSDGSPSTLNANSSMWGGPSIADVNGDGQPEIVFGGVIHDRTGKITGSSLGMLTFRAGQIPVLADVDLTGGPELVTGNGIFTYSAASQDFVRAPYFADAGPNGFTAIARFGSFPAAGQSDPGLPQIAVVSPGAVRVQTIDGRVIFGPYPLPSSTGGGPPTIGDFNGDGQPDIAAAGSDSYTVFSFHCVTDGGPLPADCSAPGVLWTHQAQDHTSNVTGSSLFDFTGAGTVSAVYADECFARVYDGKTGDVIYSQWHSSCTWYENPVIADVLANYSSQLVVPSNQNCPTDYSCDGSTEADPLNRRVDKFFNGLHCETAADCPSANDTCTGGLCRCSTDDDCCSEPGKCPANGFVCAPPPTAGNPGAGKTCRAIYNGRYPGIRIYADAQNRWADSRSIWNQHAYAVTNVNDDGTIPSAAQARHNWQVSGLNNFRQNVQGQLTPLAAAHLTVAFSSATCTGTSAALVASVCDRGAGGVAGGIPVVFQDGNGTTLCNASTDAPLGPGKCAPVSCSWAHVPSGANTIHVTVDPQNTSRPCSTEGQTATLTGFSCFAPK